MTKRIRLGLLGCGVVGGGVVEGLHQNGAYIAHRAGIEFTISRVAVRDLQRPRAPHVRREWLCTDWREVCTADNVDVVVEVMGGVSPAREAVVTALRCGKHVVTANKQLLALHGDELFGLAAETGRALLFEASVLGGIPAIHSIQTYFRANRVQRIRGILNGTCNYILTRMEEAGLEFGAALAEAQQLGYAESDPTLDIEGWDALYKLQILARLAFGSTLPVLHIERRGITDVTAAEVERARLQNCRIRHVAEARVERDGRITAKVTPQWLSPSDPLYNVTGVDNALCVSGDLVGQVLLAGPGAGAFPTASAVIEDLVKLVLSECTGIRRPGDLTAGAPLAMGAV